jgi:hypothetical protein
VEEWQTLPITYQGKELEFETRIYQFGYIHRIEVLIDDLPVQFEYDDEENYRALVTPEELSKGREISIGLLQVIAIQLKQLSTR